MLDFVLALLTVVAASILAGIVYGLIMVGIEVFNLKK